MPLRIPNLGRPRPPFIAALAASLVLVGMTVVERFLYQPPSLPSVELSAAVLPGAVIALTNDERKDNNLGTLRANGLLNQAAQLKADDMAAKSYYAHVSPDGTIPPYWLNRVGYKYSAMGENLVVDRESSEAVVSAWMGSHDHRVNILNAQFTEIGIGVAYGTYKERDTIYVVQMLARPQQERAPEPRVVVQPKPASKPTPKPIPPVVVPTKTVATTSVLVRPPAPKPVVKDTLTPILTTINETISSSTLIEVPELVASSTYPPPILPPYVSPPAVELAAVEPGEVVVEHPQFRFRMRALMDAVGMQFKSFFSPIL